MLETINMGLKQWGRSSPWKIEDFNTALSQIDHEITQRGVNIRWRGADPTGAADSSTALISVIDDDYDAVWNPKGIYLIAKDVTVPEYEKLIFDRNARYIIAKGVTLTLNCAIEAHESDWIFDLSLGGMIAGSIKNNVISPHWFGVKGDGTDETNVMRNMFDNVPNNVEIHFKKHFCVTEEISINKPIKILGFKGAIFEQKTWGKPFFRVNTDNVEIDGDMKIINSGIQNGNVSGLNGTPVSTEPARDYCAGIYGYLCNGLKIARQHEIKFEGFYCAVSLYGKDELSVDNEIGNIKINNVSFGLLASAQKEPKVGIVSGTYVTMPNGGVPPHLIYFTGGARGIISESLFIDTLIGIDGVDSTILQLKHVKDFYVDKVKGTNCYGMISLDNTADGTINSIHGKDIIGNQGIYFIGNTGGHQRLNINDIYLEGTAPLINCNSTNDKVTEGITLGNVKIVTNSPTPVGVVCTLRGSNHRVNNFECIHRNAVGNGIEFWGSKHSLGGIKCENTGTAIYTTNAIDTNLTYNFGDLDGASVRLSASSRVLRNNLYQVLAARIGNENVYDPDAGKGTIFEIRRTNANAYTILNPLNPADGLILTFILFHNFVGTVGRMSWGDQFITFGPLEVTSAKRKKISFIYEIGISKWVEQFRTEEY